MKKIHLLLWVPALAATLLSACDKNDEYLPPEWNYPIPETPLTAEPEVGAFYSNKTDQNWASAQGYTPLLNLVQDPEGGTTETVVYTSTQDGVLTQQCAWADAAGIDFFIVAWNGSAADEGLVSAYEYYRTETTRVRLAVNYDFSHLKLTALTGEGPDFEAAVADFKALYTTLFSKPYYYRLPDGRPLIVFPGNASTSYDYATFIPAFREAMRTFTQELQLADPDVEDNVLNFYILGENTTNWSAPQTNAEAGRWLDGNYVKKWYPTTYYERWYCFYSFTDMAWANWRSYADQWKNDFVPAIYPEYYTTEKGARSIERSAKNYTDFCNVAKRNMGSQRLVLIDSWNDFTNDTALEPTSEYADTYLRITRSQLSRQ